MFYELKVRLRRFIHYEFGGDSIYNPRGDERIQIGYDALIRAPFPFWGYIGAFNYPNENRFLKDNEVIYDWDRK